MHLYGVKIFLVFIILFSACSKKKDMVFPVVPIKQFEEGKKGFAITTGKIDWADRVERLNVNWNYTWGPKLSLSQPSRVEYVPMFWGVNSVTPFKMDEIKLYFNNGQIRNIIGFNEPDKLDQSNMSVDQAIALWKELVKLDIPIGSPVTSDPLNSWMMEFMQKAKANNLRIDFFCMHSYGGINDQALMDKIQTVYNTYGLPIWLTELGVADWNATTIDHNRYTPEEVLDFMKRLLPQLEESEIVERYAWYSTYKVNSALWSSMLFTEEGELTPLGKYYAAY